MLRKMLASDEEFEGHIREWLRLIGHDANNLCIPQPSHREYGGITTALFEACYAGRLEVCTWIYSHGGSATLRSKDIHGNTTMVCACREGHLRVAKWLFAMGDASDIRSVETDTPMMNACQRGHLRVAKWLFQVGARNDIFTPNDFGFLPLYVAKRYTHVALWLVLQGAANSGRDEASHVSLEMIESDVGLEDRLVLRHSLDKVIAEHLVFVNSVLIPTALESDRSKDTSRVPPEDESRHRHSPQCLLHLLRGHEGTLLRDIADFIGVTQGRQLRNAREATAILYSMEEHEGSRLRSWDDDCEKDELDEVHERSEHQETVNYTTEENEVDGPSSEGDTSEANETDEEVNQGPIIVSMQENQDERSSSGSNNGEANETDEEVGQGALLLLMQGNEFDGSSSGSDDNNSEADETDEEANHETVLYSM